MISRQSVLLEIAAMNTQSFRIFLARFFVTLCVSGLSVGFAADSGKKSKSKNKAKAEAVKKALEADKLFDDSPPLHIKIEIPPDGMAVLGKYQWVMGQQQDRESVKVTVREGENTYNNVALHIKGAAGSFRSIGDTNDGPALTLNFDKHVDGQRFHGLTKLSLNNSVQDPTYASEQFSREMFLKAGVPTPRATQVYVELNERNLGPYVLVEGFNKQFLRRHFKNVDGNLYDGGFVKDVDAELSTNSGDNPKDQSDRIALAKAAKEVNGTNGIPALEKILDVDRFLSYLAMDIMLWNWDGYPMNKNNWRLFHDRETGKMIFIPHGLDQMFWKPDGSLLPSMQGMVARAVLQSPDLRNRYFERIKQLRSTVFQVEAMTNRVRQLAARVAPTIKERDPKDFKEHEEAVAKLCRAIVERARSIDEQLATPPAAIKFDEAGFASLATWQSKSDFGHPVMTREPGEDGKETLHLTTKKGSSIGSFRTKVWLEKGKYVVEGKVKTRGIVPDIGDSRGGAGLGLARRRDAKPIAGTKDWTAFTHEFSVEEPLGQAQIVCEFRGAEGEAWFDLQSLRVKRVPEPKSK